jgi:hypothetical protein
MASKTSAPTHFVVERLNWRRVGGAFCRLPGETGVASFATADEAEVFRRDREAEARKVVNPFAGAVGLHAVTALPEPVLCDWLEDHGIDPPAVVDDGTRDWAKWWEEVSPGWTEAQRERAWQRLDRVSFFRVEQRPRRPVVYAVVRIVWQYNDEWYYPGTEGGEVTTAYRSRERAEEECARQNERERQVWTRRFQQEGWGYEPAGLNQFDLEGRLLPGADPFGPPPQPARTEDDEGDEIWTFTPDEVPFFEVVEIELEGDV